MSESREENQEPHLYEEHQPEDEFTGWLCDCGHFQKDAFHCISCGREPPWGCACCQDNEGEGNGSGDLWDYECDDSGYPKEYEDEFE